MGSVKIFFLHNGAAMKEDNEHAMLIESGRLGGLKNKNLNLVSLVFLLDADFFSVKSIRSCLAWTAKDHKDFVNMHSIFSLPSHDCIT